jgi:hypothetical protein
MSYASAQPEPTKAWPRARQCLRTLRDWPGNANNPYSPSFSIALLAGVALIIYLGR